MSDDPPDSTGIKHVTQSDITKAIHEAWPETERRLVAAAWPGQYNPSQEELRWAHSQVASRQVWLIIREIVGADDRITWDLGTRIRDEENY